MRCRGWGSAPRQMVAAMAARLEDSDSVVRDRSAAPVLVVLSVH